MDPVGSGAPGNEPETLPAPRYYCALRWAPSGWRSHWCRRRQRRDLPLELVRNGSRGLFWLEPLLEAGTGRRAHRLRPGGRCCRCRRCWMPWRSIPPRTRSAWARCEDIPFLKSQQRLTFARAGQGDPLCLDTYRSLDGFAGLERALRLEPQDIVNIVTESGLRGRGGAAFPAGIKWQTVLDTPARQKYIVCNADEGDSGTFADRLLMEADPYQLIEGMIIAGLAVGATRGYIYLRSEYPRAREVLAAAIARARAQEYLGDNIRGSGQDVPAGADDGRRRLYLRRGDLPAGEPGGQARHGAGQAAPAGHRRPVRPAHGGEQCADPGGGDHGAGQRRRVLPRLRHGPLPRYPGRATGGQYPPRRPGGIGFRCQPAPAGGGIRWWQPTAAGRCARSR